MSKFQDLLNYFEKNASTMRQKGSIFEKFVKKFLQIEPTYANQFEKVWLWSEFPYRDGMPDTGIDIVAKCRNREEYCAIQCKFYASETSVSKADVDTFLSASSTTFYVDNSINYFTQRIVISTTDKWSLNAEATIANQMIPVGRIRLQDFEAMAIDWEQFDIENIDGMRRSAIKHILPHQKEALDAVINGFDNNDRGKLIMACGTGKTFTSLKIVEAMTQGKGNVIFFVPSISLLNQTLVEWSEQSSFPFNMLAICSDSKASKKNNDEIVDLVIPATTDSKKLVDCYNSFNKDQITFIFSTYQSIDVVSKFQKDTGIVFDICVCDEAHRTTGVTLADDDESAFVKVHSNENIKAKKRLYMTATPRVYGDESKNKADEANAEICSMDDESKFGPEFYKLGFGKAVELGLLSDYKVIVLTVSEEYVSRQLQKLFQDSDGELQLEDSVKIIGCWNGLSKITCYDEDKECFDLDPEPMKTSVAFCNTIANSKAFKDKFEMIETYYKTNNVYDKRVNIEIEHVDGKMNSLERKQKLEWLKKSNTNGTCRILTNARCLSEGIDVPALDSVMFLSPRNSIIDIIQSVGRVMRRPYDGNKKYGYIILPIGIPAGVEPDKALNDNKKYKVVWDVLQALRAHDDRFNNTINKIDLNKKKPHNIQIIGVGYGEEGENANNQIQENKNKAYKKMSLDLDMEVLKDQVYAKIVKKCGSRQYWENWAKDVADIANRHITQIKVLLEQSENKKIFDNFVNSLRSILNPSITNEDAIEMLAEHLITKPVFDALFDNYSFVKSNSVSRTMQDMLDLLDRNAIEQDQKTLEKFYDSVRERASGVDNSLGKQKIVIELYDKFFRVALKKQVEKLGIVYTPTEVVDFIIHSVEKLINKEFGKSLADKDVHILDPFTGTGTFIVRLIQSGIISKDDILYKYTTEIHANEIVLLAYYIAAVNIEEAFHELYGKEEYVPFDNIVLTDTFELSENKIDSKKGMKTDNDYFEKNSEKARKQVESKIQVIIGNPPYSIGQKSANDDAQNIEYFNLDRRISETYSKGTDATLQKGLYDSYIRAFRWASDRIEDKGIIGYVTNGSYIDNLAFNGFRKSVVDEFNSVYCFNLRGNQRTSGELSRKEGGKIFGSGSRTPIAIMFLIKNIDYPKDGFIHYCDIGDYLSREDKLTILKDKKHIENIVWEKIVPDSNNDWINKKNPEFDNFILLGSKEKENYEVKLFSNNYAIGINTGRDSWIINYSKEDLLDNSNRLISNYNREVELASHNLKHTKCNDGSKISWTRKLDNYYKGLKNIADDGVVKSIMYRPYCKSMFYDKDELIESPGLWRNIYPSNNSNLVIAMTNKSSSKDYSCFITDSFCSLDLMVHCQCFPLYWYDKQAVHDLFNLDNEEYSKEYAISDDAFNKFKEKYGQYITKEDLFYYIFGVLNSKKYQELYADNLKKEMPRIPFLNHFDGYVKAAKKLADLELNYESTPHLSSVVVEKKSDNYKVTQMKFAKDGKNVDKTTIIFNENITVKNIPIEAYDYIVNGKSAIEWIMERYCVSQDKASGIVNDCNKYSDDPKYVLNLLLSVIAMSIKINETIKELPEYEEI